MEDSLLFTKNSTSTIDLFHQLYYNSYVWMNTYWLGIPVLKCPLDLWIYQEIIYEMRPDVIIECGTASGGSALFLASICDLIGHGKVITCDIRVEQTRPTHPRIIYLEGSSISREIVEKIRDLISSTDKVMVILDSDHSKEHVLKELEIYSKFVTKGSYLIVEDTNINGHPVYPSYGLGPVEAVEEFLKQSSEYVIDKSKEKFYLTFNPHGYLKKIIRDEMPQSQFQVLSLIPKFHAQLFWATKDEDFTEEHCKSIFAPMSLVKQHLFFNLPLGVPVQRVRFDPVGRPGVFQLFSIRLVEKNTRSTEARTVWQLEGTDEIVKQAHLDEIYFCNTALGVVLLALTNDPKVTFEFPESIIPKEGMAWSFEVEMKWSILADFLITDKEQQVTQLKAKQERLAQEVVQLEATVQTQREVLVQVYDSLAWQLITAWRSVKDKVLPVGKRRRRGWDLIIKSIKVIQKEGFLVFWNKVYKRMHMPAFLEIIFRRKFVMSLKPVHDIKPSVKGSGRWFSNGTDPQFLLEGPLPTGWVKVSYQPPVKGIELARLYFDVGSGFKEENSLQIGFSESNTWPIFLSFKPEMQQIRLDPREKEGEFELGGLSSIRVSRLEIALTILISRFMHHYRHGTLIRVFRKTVQIIFSGNLTDIRDKFRMHLPDLGVSDADRYKIWLNTHVLTDEDYFNMTQKIKSFHYYPKFSIVVPVYNVNEKWLSLCIKSVLAQVYPYFELCLADDASTLRDVRRVLEKYKSLDDRVKVLYREENGDISAATNSALSLATGDYVCLMDHDDEISPEALFEFARLLNEDPDIDMIYSDEDKIDIIGRRFEPFLKPDWSPEYLESCMYTCHFTCYRRQIVKELGGFRGGYNGAQDYDFVLRFVEVARKIKHISKILYHWRAIPGSTALEMSEKKYVLEAGVKALSDRVARKGCKGTVKISLFPGCFNILYEIVRNPLISIIIPSAGKKSVIRGTNIDLLANCIESIVHKSTYRNYEIIVVDNDDLEKSTIERISNHVKHSIHFKKPFNVASKMNLGAQYASGDYLLFLNDDTEVISHDWLEGLLGLAQWEAIGVVGAKLLFEDGTIQHAGVAFTDDGLPDHVFRSYPGNLPGHFYNVCGNRNYLAVTGACLLTKKDVFHKVSGFNEDFAINYNDIDYCLKVHDAGFRIVYTPHAVLYHYESRSRERTVSQQEIDLFLDLWFKKTKRDPYYHPHLDCRPPNFKINIR